MRTLVFMAAALTPMIVAGQDWLHDDIITEFKATKGLTKRVAEGLSHIVDHRYDRADRLFLSLTNIVRDKLPTGQSRQVLLAVLFNNRAVIATRHNSHSVAVILLSAARAQKLDGHLQDVINANISELNRLVTKDGIELTTRAARTLEQLTESVPVPTEQRFFYLIPTEAGIRDVGDPWCVRCDGRGVVECRTCRNGAVRRYRIVREARRAGSGVLFIDRKVPYSVTCSVCNGTDQLECTACNGRVDDRSQQWLDRAKQFLGDLHEPTSAVPMSEAQATPSPDIGDYLTLLRQFEGYESSDQTALQKERKRREFHGTLPRLIRVTVRIDSISADNSGRILNAELTPVDRPNGKRIDASSRTVLPVSTEEALATNAGDYLVLVGEWHDAGKPVSSLMLDEPFRLNGLNLILYNFSVEKPSDGSVSPTNKPTTKAPPDQPAAPRK